MSESHIIHQIRAALPLDKQAINREGDMIVIIERDGRIPVIANLSRLSLATLQSLAQELGVLICE